MYHPRKVICAILRRQHKRNLRIAFTQNQKVRLTRLLKELDPDFNGIMLSNMILDCIDGYSVSCEVKQHIITTDVVVLLDNLIQDTRCIPRIRFRRNLITFLTIIE